MTMGKVGTYERTPEIRKKMSEGAKRRDSSTRLVGESHPRYKPNVAHECRVCGGKIARGGKGLCWSCYKETTRGENHPNYKNGMFTVGVCDQCGKEIKQKTSDYNKVKHHFCSKKCDGKWKSLHNLGIENHNYKGGKIEIKKELRHCSRYREWRDTVYRRDGYVCQNCGDMSAKGHKVVLEAHHIKEFAYILRKHNLTVFIDALNCEELWDVGNGVTLCRACHDKTKRGGPLKIERVCQQKID